MLFLFKMLLDPPKNKLTLFSRTSSGSLKNWVWSCSKGIEEKTHDVLAGWKQDRDISLTLAFYEEKVSKSYRIFLNWNLLSLNKWTAKAECLSL